MELILDIYSYPASIFLGRRTIPYKENDEHLKEKGFTENEIEKMWDKVNN
jgi:hypothetical protein